MATCLTESDCVTPMFGIQAFACGVQYNVSVKVFRRHQSLQFNWLVASAYYNGVWTEIRGFQVHSPWAGQRDRELTQPKNLGLSPICLIRVTRVYLLYQYHDLGIRSQFLLSYSTWYSKSNK